jgi:flagellar motor protein MotB
LKALLVYFVALLMFSTSSLYILVSIYGESIESSKAHGLQLVEGQSEETTESSHNEEQEGAEIHNESAELPEQRIEEQEALEQNTNEAQHIETGENTNETEHIEGGEESEETIHQEASENQRRALEFPLSISAGIGYVQ